MIRTLILLSSVFILVHQAEPGRAQKPKPISRADIPYFTELQPKPEHPVTAVVSDNGMRVLVSRDDGKTWEQTFLLTDKKEELGPHSSAVVRGVTYTDGVLAAFSGWGGPGHFLGSTDGEKWGYLTPKDMKMDNVWAWDAAAGKGVMLTTASMYQPMALATKFTQWKTVPVGKLLEGEKTHHMVCGYGEHAKGTFVVVGDNQQVLTSSDLGATWAHATIPGEAGKQDAVAFGNGAFLCSFPTVVARSEDGGKTWKLHPHGVKGQLAWRGLSFLNGEFWLTSKGGKSARRSKDGITWEDLPAGTPGGKVIATESGTILNVEHGRYDIRRSTDGKTWETVFKAPEQSLSWNLALMAHGRVAAPAK